MKKKSAILALLLAGVMSFGVMASAGCKKKQPASTGNNNGTITIPDDETPKDEKPDIPVDPVDPDPVDPVDPDPVDPVDPDPDPVDPDPVDPVDPDPVDPDPVDPVDPDPPVGPVDPDPVDPVDPAKKTYTVKFMDGGEEVSSETVEEGNVVSAPSRAKPGHYLTGWYGQRI